MTKKNTAPTVTYNALAAWFRQDVRNAAALIKGGMVSPAQHAEGTLAYLAYRVAYHAAVLAEGGTLAPIPFHTTEGDTSLFDGGVYYSDAFARVVALYLAGKRSFPRAV